MTKLGRFWSLVLFAPLLAVCLHAQVITSVSGVSPLGGDVPAITSGTFYDSFTLSIDGSFPGGFRNVRWFNTVTGATQIFTFSDGVFSVTGSNILVAIPRSLYGALVSSPQLVQITVTVQDEVGPPRTSNPGTFFVNPPLLSVGQALPAGTVNAPYNQPFATGGTPPFSRPYGNSSFPLPPSLVFGSDFRFLTGACTQVGFFLFDAAVQDAWFNFAGDQYGIQCVTSAILQSISPKSAPAGSPGLTGTIAGLNFVVTGVIPPPPVGEAEQRLSRRVKGLDGSAAGVEVPGSQVLWFPPGTSPANSPGIPLDTVVTNIALLTFQIPASLLTTPGVATIYVVQPDGSLSNGLPFTISSGLQITTASPLPPGTTGAAYSLNFGAAGGAVPFTFTLAGGTLPATFTLAPNGLLSGTPNANGTFQFTVRVTDGQNATVTKDFTLVIAPSPLTLTGTVANVPVGTNLNVQFGATGGVPPYRFSVSGTIPTGTTFTQAGLLSGIANTPGSFTFTVAVTDSLQASVNRSFTITVTPGPLTITGSLPNGAVGVNYVGQLGATGGTPGYTFTATGLPPGVTLSPSGAASGIPTTAGTSNVAVTVTDSRGIQATQNFSVVIAAAIQPLTITTAALPNGVVNTSYAATLTASGGTPPYTWASTGLPAGVTISTDGVLGGSPTTEGSATVVVTVTDSKGLTAIKNFPVTILGGLRITTFSLPQGATGQGYFASLNATGGTQPLTWSATGLPAGLGINASNGTISGAPGVAGNFTVNVTVRDAGVQVASAQLPLSVIATATPPLVITTTSLPQGTVGSSYGVVFGADGGRPGYSFVFAGGTLPPGLNLLSDGTLTGVPTTPGPFRFSIAATDTLGGSVSKEFNLVILPLPLTVTGTVSDGVVGTPLSFQFGASGGTPPYTFASSGTPPTGTSFAGNVLSGTPQAEGTFTFTVTVTDNAKQVASKNFTVKVAPPPILITGSLGNGVVGTAYSAQLSTSGGTAPIVFSATGLPPGVTLSAGGAASGTPTADGTFAVVVTVNDGKGLKVSQTFSVVITLAPLTITNAALPGGVIGVAYSVTLGAAGGLPPYSFSVTGLPAGLTASGETISGSPTARGTSSVIVTVTDSKKAVTTKTFDLVVEAAPLLITTASLPAGTVGTTYSAQLAASGGVQPYTFTGTGLPAGLTVGSGGAISGSPTTPGTSSFTATVKDNLGVTANRTYQITIALPAVPPLSLTGLPATTTPATQPRLTIGLVNAFPLAVTVNLTITFVADIAGLDDSTIQFSSGGRTAQFVIPAGSTTAANDVGIQTGTLAGTITITARLTAGGQDVTPNPPPTQTIRINATPPVIQSVTATRNATGFNVVISGFASSREITQVLFTFTGASGANLQTTSATLPVDTMFSQFFSSPAAASLGGQFSLTQPFTVNGSAQSILSVTVTLVSRAGNSNVVTANLQ